MSDGDAFGELDGVSLVRSCQCKDEEYCWSRDGGKERDDVVGAKCTIIANRGAEAADCASLLTLKDHRDSICTDWLEVNQPY